MLYYVCRWRRIRCSETSLVSRLRRRTR